MPRHGRRVILPALALALSSACREVGAPDRESGPVRLQLQLVNVLSGETLEVMPHYQRSDQAVVPLAPITVALEAEASQTIPIEIDISDCLADAAREGTGGCPLRVAVLLKSAASEVLDSLLIGPLDARGGVSLSPPAVSLRHPDSILLTAPADSVSAGGTLPVIAQVRDRTAAPMTARPLTWSSSNPQIATVSQTGVVSGVAPGSVVITAIFAEGPTGPTGTLPLTVRGGAAVLVGPAGGTVYSNDGAATLVIPAGALAAPTAISITPATFDGPTTRLAAGTAFIVAPAGLTLLQPATLTVRYSGAAIPGGPSNEPALRLFQVEDDNADRAPGATTNPATRSITAPIAKLGSYLIGLALVGVRSLAVGDDHTCAALTTGAAICFGQNSAGQLGDGSTDPGTDNVVVGGRQWAAVTAGTALSCGLTTAGQVYCWGRNGGGQVGNGTTLQAATPQLVPLPAAAVSVSAGFDSACAVDVNRLLYCWGNNALGQLGAAAPDTCFSSPCSRSPLLVGPAAPTGTRTVSSGLVHRCELSPLQVACWGTNWFGELGLPGNTPPQSQTPVPLLTGITLPFTSLHAGRYLTCGIQSDGAAYCWGVNAHGARGDGSPTAAPSPVPSLIVGGLQFAHLGPSRASSPVAPSCGVTLAGDGYCWGANFHGALGTTAALGSCNTLVGVLGCTGTPVPVAGGLKFKEIHTGAANACGRTIADEIWCWGLEVFGRDVLIPERMP